MQQYTPEDGNLQLALSWPVIINTVVVFKLTVTLQKSECSLPGRTVFMVHIFFYHVAHIIDVHVLNMFVYV